MRKICLFLGLFVLAANILLAQERRVTGTVTSESDGTTLPGVTILVKGTTKGAITDVNGRYEINVAPEATLQFTFIGMIPQEIVVGNQTIINVALRMEMASLDEVVVVGYGTRLKSELTGSVTQVRAADIANSTQPSFESALQGKAAGVYV
jgi:TonB-dependent starch-binding outer membrane protein SusC